MASQPLNNVLQIAGVGDFNGDHKADMLLRSSDGTLQTWVGSASGAIQSPMEKQWWDAFIGTQELMGEMNAAAINAAVQSGFNVPTPQVEYMSGEMPAAAADMWYMANPSMWPNHSQTGAQQLADLLSSSNVHIALSGAGGFTADINGKVTSITPIDQANGTFDFNINGMHLIAHWNPPAGFAAPDPGAIVVTGSAYSPAIYIPSGFAVNFAENAYNPFDGFGGMGAPSYDGHHTISAAMRQAVVQKLSSDPKFWAFKLNGVDINHAILKALSVDTIYFSDDGLAIGGDGPHRGWTSHDPSLDCL